MTATRTTRDDARNRALRTLLQGLLVDVLVAVGVAVYTVVSAWQGDRIAWGVLAATVVKTVLTSVASYLMRLKVDPLNPPLPVPLPPADPGPPADSTAPIGLLSHGRHRPTGERGGYPPPASEADRQAGYREPG